MKMTEGDEEPAYSFLGDDPEHDLYGYHNQ